MRSEPDRHSFDHVGCQTAIGLIIFSNIILLVLIWTWLQNR